ncbi:MAG TPA: lipopolysaccharide heptosyltransferase II [Terriglobia bacterium]|nr:lipopolysaccharide heptosyltransferase II [Terriglobia bacterium]
MTLISYGVKVNKPAKIMVRATNWVGDAIISLPAIELLRSRYPQAEIVVVAKPWVAELYSNHPAGIRLIVYDPGGEHEGRSGFAKLIENLRRERFDAAVLFQHAFHAAWMAWRARVPIRIGYRTQGRGLLLTEAVRLPSSAYLGHQSSEYLELLFLSGLVDERPPSAYEVHLEATKAEKRWAAEALKGLGLEGPRCFVGLNPGAAFGPAKRWPMERFAELGDRLVGALGADVLVFGSKDERPLAEAVARAMQRTPLVLAGTTTLRQWMALTGLCRLVVANDSGAMHVTAAMGVPVVAIFGSTDARATGPLSPWARVVRQSVECSPCGLRECPIDFRCMNSVSVDDVHRASLELVSEYESARGRRA